MFLQVNQMQLSKKRKIFYKFSIAFLESKSFFRHFENKMSLRAQVISKFLIPKYLVT